MIQELVLVLDVRNGLGLAFILFGASVFWVPAGRFQKGPKRPLRLAFWAAGEGLVCPVLKDFPGRQKRAEKVKKREAGTGPRLSVRVTYGASKENRPDHRLSCG